MKVAALVLAFGALVHASDVVDLKSASFPTFIKEQPLTLVKYFAPWCGHCKALAPEYEKAAAALKGSVQLAKVDCTIEGSLCEQQGIQGYPTLKVFKNGQATDYKGPRQADGIVSYMKKLALPAVSDLTADNFDSFVKSFDILTLLVGSKGSEQDQFFSKFAEENNEQFVFARVSDAAIIKKAELPESGIVVLKSYDDKKVVYKGAQQNAALVEFLKGESFPLLGEVRPENYPNYVDRLLPIGLVGVTSDDDRKKASEAVLPVAKELKGKISFAFIDATKFGEYLKSLGAKGTYPNLIIQEPHKNTKFVFEKALTVDAVRTFSKDVLADKVASFIKSAEPPADNSGPLKIVVGNTYKDIVLNPENDVFIAFTATWCGHCKNLAPIWEQLATGLKNVKGVVIAKMDAAENDLPQDSPFQIQGFPTIKLFKAKTNEIVDYDGDRKLESFLSFLKSKAANGSAIDVTAEKVASVESSDDDAHDEL